MRWLCLLVLLLLVPAGLADHQQGRKFVRIDLDDDKEEKERLKKWEKEQRERQKEEEERRREAERDDDPEDEDFRSAGDDEGRRAAARDAGLPAGCVRASGGATAQGNVVAWPAQEGPVEVWRRSGDGDWQRIHEAEPGASLYVDHDLRKGRAYAYRVMLAEQAGTECPSLEMTAVPFSAGWAAAAVVAVGAGAYALAGRR